MTNKGKNLMRLFALLLALMVAASACSSDSPETSPDAESTDAETSETETSETETSETESAEVDTAEDEVLESTGDEPTSETSGQCDTGNVAVSGSSTVEPISRRAADLYQESCSDTVITVEGPGTGEGFNLFCSGATDVANASRVISEREVSFCEEAGVEYVELQVALDGIAVLTSPNNSVECLSFADLYALLGGKSEGFARWSDANGLGAELGSTVAPYPDADLVISGPGRESGTYDRFIEIALERLGQEQEGDDGNFIRQDLSGTADDNVIIEDIAGSEMGLGWVGSAMAQENAGRVKTIAVSEEPGGECVLPTLDTIANGSYPLSRSLFIYVNTARTTENSALAGYIDFYLEDGYADAVTKAVGSSGYVELPADQLVTTQDAWSAAKG